MRSFSPQPLARRFALAEAHTHGLPPPGGVERASHVPAHRLPIGEGGVARPAELTFVHHGLASTIHELVGALCILADPRLRAIVPTDHRRRSSVKFDQLARVSLLGSPRRRCALHRGRCGAGASGRREAQNSRSQRDEREEAQHTVRRDLRVMTLMTLMGLVISRVIL